ncbi:hypothetical protein AVEN_134101-1, partial [Araneus ventricosus]
FADRGNMEVDSQLQGQRVVCSRPDSNENVRAGVVWKFEKGMSAHVPSSLSDYGSKLRGPS